MADYAKKTCNCCGIRKPQYEMYRVNKEVNSGSSNTGLTKRSIFGSLIGNKKSQRQVGKFFLSPNKRNYKRKREVWMCGDCAGVNNQLSEEIENILSLVLILIIFIVLYWLTGISPLDIIEWFSG